MSIFYQARLRITDSDGVPISGGKARFYNVNTTTLTTLYTTSALTTTLTNPVVADSTGWTPQIFAAEGTVCDVQFLDASDVAVPSQSFEDVAALGSDTGTFSRTFAGGTRLKMSDSGGAVLMEFGDASPDNTGGTAKLQGWNGTQGDTLTANFAAFNAGTTAGALKENSKKLIGIVGTEMTQVTAQTSVDITLPNLPTGCLGWEIIYWDYSQSGNGNLQLRLNYGTGVKSGATDYVGYYESYDTTGAAFAGTALVTAAQLQLNSNLNGAANQLGRGRIEIITPASGATQTVIDHRSSGVLNTGAHAQFRGEGYGAGGYGTATAVQLRMSANNFTFKYMIRALRGFGET